MVERLTEQGFALRLPLAFSSMALLHGGTFFREAYV